MFVFLYFWMAILLCSPSDTLKHSPHGIGNLFTHKAVHFPLSQAHICPQGSWRQNAEGLSEYCRPGVLHQEVPALLVRLHPCYPFNSELKDLAALTGGGGGTFTHNLK